MIARLSRTHVRTPNPRPLRPGKGWVLPPAWPASASALLLPCRHRPTGMPSPYRCSPTSQDQHPRPGAPLPQKEIPFCVSPSDLLRGWSGQASATASPPRNVAATSVAGRAQERGRTAALNRSCLPESVPPTSGTVKPLEKGHHVPQSSQHDSHCVQMSAHTVSEWECHLRGSPFLFGVRTTSCPSPERLMAGRQALDSTPRRDSMPSVKLA